MKIESPAFRDKSPIPRKHTCQGADVSPPLSLLGVPPEARSLALVCDDPDAPGGEWVHWIVYDIPIGLNALPEGIEPAERVLGGAAQGRNDFGRIGWGGPCPPRGKPHRYVFTLYALSEPLGLKPGATKRRLLDKMQAAVIAEAQLVGTYQRA